MSLGISIRSVAKSFEGKTVLRDVSFEVPAGRSTVLIGPSASGKSVMARCILGLLQIDRGSVRISETGLPDLTPGAIGDIGVVFQQNALFDSMPVWENVAFRLINGRKMSRQAAWSAAIARLAEVGLSAAMATRYPSELSGGMQKRAALARALSSNPRLLILDDPTAGLDPVLTNTILSLIERCVTVSGATVLAITSDMKIARNRFDRIVMLHDGIIRWSGDSDAVDHCGDPHTRQMIMGHADGPISMRVTD